MRASVRSKLPEYQEKHEGLVYSMYADWESLITTSIGCLIDNTPAPSPWTAAMGLPWRTRYGLLATGPEVRAEWLRVKTGCCNTKRLQRRGDCPRVKIGQVCFAHDGWRASENPNSLKLLRDDAFKLVDQRAMSMWSVLVKRFPTLATAPADAQLGVMSWAWAMGANRTGWPKFFAAINARDWATCAKESKISEKGNAGVIGRNKDQVLLFENAAKVAARGLDPDVLHWPKTA